MIVQNVQVGEDVVEEVFSWVTFTVILLWPSGEALMTITTVCGHACCSKIVLWWFFFQALLQTGERQ
jgi:hypothetical protein